MRFLVEVNALGQTEAKRYGIEADTWQRALQDTRKLRGEDGPISGFSIELLDDGCRAVDPMARLRYVVKKGLEGMALGPLEDGPVMPTKPPQAPSSAPKVPATKMPPVAPVVATPAAPAAHAPATTPQAPAPPPAPAAPAVPRVAVPAAPAAAAPSPPSSASSPGPVSQRQPPPAPVSQRSAATAAAAGPPVPAVRPSGAPAARVPPAPQTQPLLPREEGPTAKVLSRREQVPTAAVPLYYREESLIIPPNVSEAEVQRMLRAHLTSLQQELSKRPRGKYVQLAAFDSPVTDKKTRPIAVLSWKDWKGLEPTISFPRKSGTSVAPSFMPQQPRQTINSDAPTMNMSADLVGAYAAQSMPPNPAPRIEPLSAPPPPPPAPPPVSVRPAAPNYSAAATAQTLPASFPPASFPPPATPGPGPAPAPMMPQAQALPQPSNGPPHAAASGQVTAPVSSFVPQQPVFQAPPVAAPVMTPAPGSIRAAAGSSGGFAAADGTGRRRAMGDKRVPGEELIAQLFEEMHALHFLADALEGGHFCLAIATEKLPSKAAYVHLYDIDKREFVLVCTRGHSTESLLLSRTGEADALLASAMRKRRAVVVNDPAEESGTQASRFAPIGGIKRIIVSPVMLAGRFLGAIELINPVDGAPFTDLEGNAISYMAEQYAEFVAARGVVLEPEKVNRASTNARA